MKSTGALTLLCTLGGVSALALPSSLEPQICRFEEHAIQAHEVPDASLVKRQSGWNPPTNLRTALDQVWEHQMKTYSNPMGFKNYGYDQVIAGKGKINFCVRWESNAKVSQQQRQDVQKAIQRSFKKWIDVLVDFDGFPYKSVDVSVVGWAVRDRSILQGDTSGIDVYTNRDREGIPECDPRCGRFFHQDGNYASCPSGAARHYDQSVWLTDGMQGGAGGDWGQRIGREYFMSNVHTDNIHILLHEMGHTFALDDFYDWSPPGQQNFLMKAGSAQKITDFDAWMARDWWRHLKPRYRL